MQGNLIVVAAVFALSVLVLIGVGLFVLMLFVEARRRHRKRLARVSRRRMSGRLDLDDARLMLLAKPKDETSLWVRLSIRSPGSCRSSTRPGCAPMPGARACR